MKKKILCLMLALTMLVPMCFMTACNFGGDGDTTETDDSDNIVDKASESTVTLTMFMITERHVPTEAEIEAVKNEKGANSNEYNEVRGIKEAYDNVASALDKITKAKFRTHLITTFYTIEEYKQVEELLRFHAEKKDMMEKAEKALSNFMENQQAMGITDTDDIMSMFYVEYPEFAQYTAPVKVEETVVTEAETITNEYGIKELKYPDAQQNQVDIVCVCGYDKYLEYLNAGWLKPLSEELNGASKSILTYVNEKFMTAATIDGETYAIPNNMPIGEYTYLLVSKYLLDYYGYDHESIQPNASRIALLSTDLTDFFKDIYEYRKDITPLTGDLGMTSEYFWTLNYEYTKEEKTYDKANQLSTDTLYFVKREAENGEAKYIRVVTTWEDDVKYYTYNATTKKYTEAKKPTNGKFTAKTVYYTKNANYYEEVAVFESGMELYTVKSASFDHSEFSVLGTALGLTATKGYDIAIKLFNNTTYKNLMKKIQELKDSGYYVPDAENFAAKIVKGGNELADQYADDYYMYVLEYPRAYKESVCENLIGVNASSVSAARSMEVITYLTTNSAFRNLLQYGIEGDDYKIENVKIDPDSDKTYPKLTRSINGYYKMDLYKTGNVFIAYPEENMIPNIWDYGKQQNKDAKYDPMIDFDITTVVGQIDFPALDELNALSKKYKEQLDACKNSAELDACITNIEKELSENTLYLSEVIHGVAVGDAEPLEPEAYNEYGLYHFFYDWWAPLYFQDE